MLCLFEQMCVKPAALYYILQRKYTSAQVRPCPQSEWECIGDVRVEFDNSNWSILLYWIYHVSIHHSILFLLWISKWVIESVPFTPKHLHNAIIDMHINNYISVFVYNFFILTLKHTSLKCTIQWVLTNV